MAMDNHHISPSPSPSLPHPFPLNLPFPSSSSRPLLKPSLPSDVPTPPPDRPARDDCWTETATLALIDAWGDRYLDLNRGNLKQKDWKDVADAVNAREDDAKRRKTDIQCKNRMDTLKKKFKLEKSKIVATGGPSKWPFFDRLDELVGPSKKQKKLLDSKPYEEEIAQKKPSVPSTAIVPFTAHPNPDDNVNNVNDDVNTDTISMSKESPDMTDSCPQGFANEDHRKSSKKRRLFDDPMKDLARSILKFAEVYERIETSRQQQMIDLERQRMQFIKDLELQRMQLFMQTQLELAKLKHRKHGSKGEHYS